MTTIRGHRREEVPRAIGPAGRSDLDEIERGMIELLQRDGRMSAAELARNLGVSELTARRKLSRLVDDEVIRVVAMVDPFDVGYETPVIIGLKVVRSKIEQVAEALSRHPSVRYVGASTGRIDLIVEVVARTNQDLATFLVEFLAGVDGIIETETHLIVKIFKQAWEWGVRGSG